MHPSATAKPISAMTASQPDRGFVVITGTSTGIGAATALHLAEKGFRVLAGVRRRQDGEGLVARSSGELSPIIIDVTKESSIAAATDVVASAVGDRGLAGLVNNAGIVRPCPVEVQPIAEFRRHLDVNLIGPVRTIQAFLPLIRRGKGRIVNVGSIGGRLALPMHGAYSASKFGIEALTDSLRLELRQWGIPVALVDPGAVTTAIFGKELGAIDGLETTLEEEDFRRYEAQISAVRQLVEKTAADAESPVVIAKAIAHALMSAKPKTRYLAGHGAKAVATLARATSGTESRIARLPATSGCRRRSSWRAKESHKGRKQ